MSSNRRPLGLNQWRHNERPCTPAAGWEKGQVEKQVQFLRGELCCPKLAFDDLDALNDWLRLRCAEPAERHHPAHRILKTQHA
ncbi:hypothetical protein ACROSR_01525 [Roseovarius tibetensis]|uniref:hypothetical protein n=1 Tax=Roseovarius tibetensis TaxID=2685897 RepID=UPI003D7FD070